MFWREGSTDASWLDSRAKTPELLSPDERRFFEVSVRLHPQAPFCIVQNSDSKPSDLGFSIETIPAEKFEVFEAGGAALQWRVGMRAMCSIATSNWKTRTSMRPMRPLVTRHSASLRNSFAASATSKDLSHIGMRASIGELFSSIFALL